MAQVQWDLWVLYLLDSETRWHLSAPGPIAQFKNAKGFGVP